MWLEPSILNPLEECIREQIARQDTRWPLFHGCYDWHSAVHGHWAAIWLAQTSKSTLYERELQQRLNSAAMLSEFNYLRENPTFEQPYGRAWLLRLGLLVEPQNQSIQDGFYDCAASLERWLETPQNPKSPEYTNPCWAVTQLAAWYAHTQNAEGLKRCGQWAEGFADAFCDRPQQDVHKGEFFSMWGVQTLMIERVLGPQALQGKLVNSPKELVPIEPLLNAHHLGMNASRAWGCDAAYRATGDLQWRLAYNQHVRASLNLHDKWVDDTVSYTHWVPQFTIYAIASHVDFQQVTSMS